MRRIVVVPENHHSQAADTADGRDGFGMAPCAEEDANGPAPVSGLAGYDRAPNQD